MGEKILEELFDFLLEIYGEHGQNINYYENSLLELIRHFIGYINKYKIIFESEGMVPKMIEFDFIAGMTDGYALKAFNQIKIPQPIRFK